MTKKIVKVAGVLLYCIVACNIIKEVVGDPKEACHPRNQTYKIADSRQCDRYYECTKTGNGKTLDRLCLDGFVFSEEIRDCDYPHNVNCTGREALQEPASVNPNCYRLNGLYAFPPADSCQRFYHCLEGVAYEKTCPEGVIFDPATGTCVHPDLSRRPDCAAKSVLNYTCPNHGKKFARLRFGDHDRLPHPSNCRKYFICFADGKPRVGGCPLGKVFNPKTGVCDSPKKVPQCKDYYGKKDLAKLAKFAELGEEGSLIEDEEALEEEIYEENDHDAESVNEATSDKKNAANKGKKFHSKRQYNSDAPNKRQFDFALQNPAFQSAANPPRPSQVNNFQQSVDDESEENSSDELDDED